MRDLISAFLGVPATILLAAGLGLAGVTLVSRVRGRRQPPLRWRHLLLGIGALAAGVALMALDLAVIPPGG
ncbi:MAG TPA: hypothetical protein VEK76_12135 [Candidatus Binatia bacterium]|nr:hypothetical protein [Candidatus Binatia bacterium]